MSLDLKSVSLLTSQNPKDQAKGLVAIIDASTKSSFNIDVILNTITVEQLLQLIGTIDKNVAEKTCWLISNLCLNEKGRKVMYEAGLVRKLCEIFKWEDKSVITKACAAITNLSKYPSAQKEMANGDVMDQLVSLLKANNIFSSDVEKAGVLKSISSLSVADTTGRFSRAGGVKPTVQMLSSNQDAALECSLTLITSINEKRDEAALLEMADYGAIHILCQIAESNKTIKFRQISMTALAQMADLPNEKILFALVEQDTVGTCIRLLSDTKIEVAIGVAGVLKNLFNSDYVRQQAKGLDWFTPVLNKLKTGSPTLLKLILETLINASKDNHYRAIMLREKIDIAIQPITKFPEAEIVELAVNLQKDLSIPIHNSIREEVAKMNLETPKKKPFVKKAVSSSSSSSSSSS